MTISIFGDSFAARYGSKKNPHYFENETGNLWYDILKEESGEKLNIFATGGLGPYTTFEEFYEQFENNSEDPRFCFKVDDKLIFVLSCQYRLPIDISVGELEHNQPIILDVLHGKKDTVLQSLEYEIFFVNKIFKEEIFRANLKNIYFLKTLSQIKKLKTMVFLGFKFNRYGIHDHVDINKIYELDNLNDEYFQIFTKPLYHVSLEESVHKKDYDNMTNFRANHFSYCNHQIMANKILNFFYDKTLDDTFKTNFLTVWNNPEEGRDHFLYD